MADHVSCFDRICLEQCSGETAECVNRKRRVALSRAAASGQIRRKHVQVVHKVIEAIAPNMRTAAKRSDAGNTAMQKQRGRRSGRTTAKHARVLSTDADHLLL